MVNGWFRYGEILGMTKEGTGTTGDTINWLITWCEYSNKHPELEKDGRILGNWITATQ